MPGVQRVIGTAWGQKNRDKGIGTGKIAIPGLDPMNPGIICQKKKIGAAPDFAAALLCYFNLGIYTQGSQSTLTAPQVELPQS